MNPFDWIKANNRRRRRASQIAHHEILLVKPARQSSETGLMAFSRARDEILRLPYFLDHYRKLGVGRFVIIENGSRDGTLEYLCSQDDVDVYTTASPFGESSAGLAWMERVIQASGVGGWVLVADIDELLVYEDWQRSDLNRLADFLDREGSHALKATMVDMYSGPEHQANAAFLWERYPFLDATSYQWKATRGGGAEVVGGPRHRMMKAMDMPPDSNLTKYPFFRWSKKSSHSSIHLLKPTPRKNIPRAGLLHFKFMDDFAARAQDLQLTAGYHEGGLAYQKYREMLSKGPVEPYYEGSVVYEGVDTLLEHRLIAKLGLTAG